MKNNTWYIIGSFLSLMATVLFVLNTSPSTLHPLGFIFLFFCIYFFVYCLAHLVYSLFNFALTFLSLKDKKIGAARSQRKLDVIIAIIAFAPPVLLAMNTVGANSIFEVMLVLFFELIVCFYVIKKM